MDAISLDTFRDVRSSAGTRSPQLRAWVRAFAPVYFCGFSVLRCYIETGLMARESFFSVYTALHHTLWNAATIWMIILAAHLVLKVQVQRLLWLMYGITLMAIPLLYAVVSGRHLQLEYLNGSFTEIVGDIFTFCFLSARNKPLSIEITLIFLSMLAVGYGYSRSWTRALVLALTVHLLGNIFAIHWIGTSSSIRAVFQVGSRLSNHQFMAGVWLLVVTVLIFIAARRAGVLTGTQPIRRKLFLWTFSAWAVYAVVIHQTGWFEHPFDIFISGLPPATSGFLAAAVQFSQQRVFTKTALVVAGLILMLQLAVMAPVYLHQERWFFERPALPEWLVPVK